MVHEIKIKNFKSIEDLKLPIGRFSVLIGSNGSGKSNILEAIAFGGAASADKLDNEFLVSRGIRTGTPQLMKNAFVETQSPTPVRIGFHINKQNVQFTISESNKSIFKWEIEEKKYLRDLINLLSNERSNTRDNQNSDANQLMKYYNSSLDSKKIKTLLKNLSQMKGGFENSININNEVFKILTEDNLFVEELASFIIYSPEINFLRKFDDESQIKPLGIRGEGLFNLLQIFDKDLHSDKPIEEIKHFLQVIEWFDDFEFAIDKVTGRKSIAIKDRYIHKAILNQANVNEGFLFLLFFISLFISSDTPKFFAIDNIEGSFHPRLCEDLIKNLVELSKRHDKQVILTTQNPFVLDGLDLSDPEQCLFVVRRNADGATIADKIINVPPNIKLSESWMRGYIGGQPETIG